MHCDSLGLLLAACHVHLSRAGALAVRVSECPPRFVWVSCSVSVVVEVVSLVNCPRSLRYSRAEVCFEIVVATEDHGTYPVAVDPAASSCRA